MTTPILDQVYDDLTQPGARLARSLPASYHPHHTVDRSIRSVYSRSVLHMAPGPQAPTSSAEETALMRRVAQGDREAFQSLYHRYVPRLGRYLSRMLRLRELVEEVVNDTLLAVWQSAGRFDPDTAGVSTWIFGVAHHKALKALSRLYRDGGGTAGRESTDPDADDPVEEVDLDTPERTVAGWEIGQALATALEELSPEHRSVLELAFAEGFSYREISAVLDCPVNTVKTRVFNARKRLADILARMGIEHI
ncbi:MAG: RNA polymerase sigma factor [Gammaproteobacteria bacterium]